MSRKIYTMKALFISITVIGTIFIILYLFEIINCKNIFLGREVYEKGFINGKTECTIIRKGKKRCKVSYQNKSGRWFTQVFYINEIKK